MRTINAGLLSYNWCFAHRLFICRLCDAVTRAYSCTPGVSMWATLRGGLSCRLGCDAYCGCDWGGDEHWRQPGKGHRTWRCIRTKLVTEGLVATHLLKIPCRVTVLFLIPVAGNAGRPPHVAAHLHQAGGGGPGGYIPKHIHSELQDIRSDLDPWHRQRRRATARGGASAPSWWRRAWWPPSWAR